MRVIRSVGIGLMRFLCLAAVAMLVYIGTLQMTILDRSEVKRWIDIGGVYENHLIPELIRTGSVPSETQNVADTQTFSVPPDALKQALERTFTPSYVKTQTETSLDKFYDWLEGKSPHFVLSIPIHEKRDVFINELAIASEPYVAALPICITNFSATLCRPAAISPAEYAKELISQNISKSGFFNKPLTTSEFADQTSPLPSPLIRIIPYLTEFIVGLVAVAIGSAGILIWLSPSHRRVKAILSLAKRIFVSQLFTFGAAILFALLFHFDILRFSNIIPVASDIIAKTIGSSIKVAFMAMAIQLAILSGISALCSLLIWLGGRAWLHKVAQNQNDPMRPRDSAL